MKPPASPSILATGLTAPISRTPIRAPQTVQASPGRHATVDGNRSAGDEARSVGAEQQRKPFQFVGIPEARHRNIGDIRLCDFRVLQRSEEHTSELQSLMRTSYADLCLKKKNIYNLMSNTKLS